MGQQLLLLRPRPLPGELLSSWLIRLAWSNGRKLHPFTHKALSLPKKFWNRDPNRVTAEEISRISTATGVPVTQVAEMAFGDPNVSENGWVLPIGQRARYWHRPGMQICPECLATDATPYARKFWRLANYPVCTTHSLRMLDRCHACTHPINMHCGDYQLHALKEDFPWVFCPFCNADWRMGPRIEADSSVGILEGKMLQAFSEGWMRIGAHHVHRVPALSGFRILCRMASSNTRSRKFSMVVAQGMGEQPFATDFSTRHQFFHELEVDERMRILRKVAWLVERWPTNFVWAARTAKLSKAYIRHHSSDLPFWLSREVEWNLDGGYYVPNEAEINCVVAYLERNGISTAKYNVRRWLGQHYPKALTTHSDHLAPIGNKWPGYGAASEKYQDRYTPSVEKS